MAWMRSGDNAATYPPLMSIAGMPQADERTINEVAGFIWRVSTMSAAHSTDYVVDMGTLYMLGGTRTHALLDFCTRAKLLTKVVSEEGLISYQMIADPEFIHLRLRAEIDWERQQRADMKDPSLTIPVRLRDGDNCRWCGVLVAWRGTKTGRSAELDHLNPGEQGTVDTMVVACRSCNGARQANVDQWDTAHTLRKPPAKPLYGKSTATFLNQNGYPDITENISSDEFLAASQAAASQQRREAQDAPSAQISHDAIKNPDSSETNSQPVSNDRSAEKEHAGSGRVGNGRASDGYTRSQGPPPAWAGIAWPSEAQTAPDVANSQRTQPKKRRRGKRGGRRK